MTERTWYVGVGGNQQGPMSTAQIVEQIQTGAVDASYFVFTTGMANWTAVTQVQPFAAYFGAADAPPPPPPPAAAAGADVIDFKLYGEDLQYVEITLDPGEACISEAGAMLFMDPGIDMETIFGDGSQQTESKGFMGKLVQAGSRVLTGESLFMTIFANQDPAQRRNVAFASPYPGTIVPLDLQQHGGKIVCQKDAFLCAARGITLGIELQRKLGAGLFGGEGFILQKIEGDGLAFVHAGGVLTARKLAAGETLRVDTGCLAAFEGTVGYDIQMVKGIKSAFFGGEGLFYATVTGPGTVWIQSLPFSRLASRVWRAAPQTGGTRVGEGSVAGGLGDILMGSR